MPFRALSHFNALLGRGRRATDEEARFLEISQTSDGGRIQMVTVSQGARAFDPRVVSPRGKKTLWG